MMMMKLQLTRKFPWVQKRQEPSHSAEAPPTPPLSAELDAYAQALDALRNEEKQMLLRVLLARDALVVARAEVDFLPPSQAQRLLELDTRLREGATELPLDALPDWRQTFDPPETAWWWRLDERIANREQQNDLPWVLLAGTFTLLTAALTTEILTRLWDGAPDTLSIFGSLLTLTLTASPLVKRGRDLGAWLVARLPKLKLHHRAEALAALTGMAFVIVLVIRLALPAVAVAYNNRGFAAKQAQHYAQAQRRLQRAVALHPDNAVAAYNLAEVYWQLREPDKARDWYARAIAADLDFAPAYRGLGCLYNAQDKPAEAQTILESGLAVLGNAPSSGNAATEADTVTRYELLAELGRAYFAQAQPMLAQRALEDALALEDMLRAFEAAAPGAVQYRSALPHYYLAQLYEQADRPQDALAHWETCLRLLRPGWAGNMAWRIEAQEHMQQLQGVLP